MARREIARHHASQTLTVQTTDVDDRDADEVTDAQLGQRRSVAVRKHGHLLRPKSQTSAHQKSKYKTARASRASCFEMMNMASREEVEVKAHIRDWHQLKRAEQWAELINRGTTHLIIEDDDNKIKAVPIEVAKIETLKSLTLIWNKIETLPSHVVKLPLNELSIQKCPLKSINGIENMRTLVKLELMTGGISILPPEFGQLEALETLNLTGNKIKALPMNMGNLRRLKMLCVCGNKLTTLPLSLTGLAGLESLDVSQNQLRDLPDLLGNISNLSTLRLTHNQLWRLPHSMKNMQKLKHLFMSSNNFQSVPAVLEQLPELHTLHLASNALGSFEGQNGMHGLVVLILDKNNFTTFPDVIFKCTKIEQLSMQFNHIGTIPRDIGKLANLRTLKLTSNDIDELPDEISALKQLRHLVLRETIITELPRFFDDLTSLSMIDIEETKLDYQFLYALKNNGVAGLFDEVRMRREQNPVKDTQSERGSSIFDSEDEAATDDELVEDNHVSANCPLDGEVQRDSGYTDDSQVSNLQQKANKSTRQASEISTEPSIPTPTPQQNDANVTQIANGRSAPQAEGPSATERTPPPKPAAKPKPQLKPSVSKKPETSPKPSADAISRTLSQSSVSSSEEPQRQTSIKRGPPPPTKPKPQAS